MLDSVLDAGNIAMTNNNNKKKTRTYKNLTLFLLKKCFENFMVTTSTVFPPTENL